MVIAAIPNAVEKKETQPLHVEVWTQDNGSSTWRSEDLGFREYCARPRSQRATEIAFITTPRASHLKQDSADSIFSPEDRLLLEQLTSVDQDWWTAIRQNASGHFQAEWKADLSELTFTSKYLVKMATCEAGKKSGLETDYQWIKVNLITRWIAATGSSITVIPHAYPQVRNGIVDLLNMDKAARPICREDPFSVFALVTKLATRQFEQAVWSWRDHIRYFELERSKVGRPEDKYKNMHELARHTIHCSELVDAAHKALLEAIEEHDGLLAGTSGPPVAWARAAVGRQLRSHRNTLSFIHGRSASMEARLKNEISLAFTLVGQHQNELSAKTADLMKTDSRIMKAIAFLGLLFLPSALVSNIFSTTFFNLDSSASSGGTSPQTSTTGTAQTSSSGLVVDPSFWIFWAISIPLTALTLLTCALWYVFYLKPRSRQVQEEENEGEVELERGDFKWWKAAVAKLSDD